MTTGTISAAMAAMAAAAPLHVSDRMPPGVTISASVPTNIAMTSPSESCVSHTAVAAAIFNSAIRSRRVGTDSSAADTMRRIGLSYLWPRYAGME